MWQDLEDGVDSSYVGCRGPPLLICPELFYLNKSTLFVVPPAHALLYGLVSTHCAHSVDCIACLTQRLSGYLWRTATLASSPRAAS